MSKTTELEKTISILKKEKLRMRELSSQSSTCSKFYFYDSLAEHLAEVIHELSRINELSKTTIYE